MHHISRAGVVWVRSWGKWSVMVIHYLIRQRRRWSFSSDSFLEVPIYWPLGEKTLMANPKQPFRGHLLRRRGDTLHKRTPPPLIIQIQSSGRATSQTAAPQPRSGRLPTQSGNANRELKSHPTDEATCGKTRRSTITFPTLHPAVFVCVWSRLHMNGYLTPHWFPLSS